MLLIAIAPMANASIWLLGEIQVGLGAWFAEPFCFFFGLYRPLLLALVHSLAIF
jgi:hypothetical protein